MRIMCQKCDHLNELGHLFCTKCGTKLDLRHMAYDMEDEEDLEDNGSTWKAVGLAVLVIFLVIVGITVWPSGPYDADRSNEGVASRIETSLSTLQLVGDRPGSEYTTIPAGEQKDANAWLANAVHKQKGISSMSIQFKDDMICFRVNRLLGPYSLSVMATPGIHCSYEINLKPDGDKLKVAGARIGHLPLPGPAGRLVIPWFTSLFQPLSREQMIYKQLTGIKVEDGKLSLTVSGDKR